VIYKLPDSLAEPDTTRLGRFYASSEDGPIASLDWAMIEIESHLKIFNHVMLAYPSRIGRKQSVETKVTTCTGVSGVLTSTMSPNPILLKLPDSQRLQEVWVVRIDGDLSKSGANQKEGSYQNRCE